jgi:hypothetical protein
MLNGSGTAAENRRRRTTRTACVSGLKAGQDAAAGNSIRDPHSVRAAAHWRKRIARKRKRMTVANVGGVLDCTPPTKKLISVKIWIARSDLYSIRNARSLNSSTALGSPSVPTPNFILAELREDPTTPDFAAAVMVWRQGRFQAIEAVIDECAAHQRNRIVFELWVLETANIVHSTIGQLDGVSARALTVYAKSVGFYDPDPADGLDGEGFHQDEESFTKRPSSPKETCMDTDPSADNNQQAAASDT